MTIEDNWFAFIIRWSKTIQYMQHKLRIPVLPFPDHRICPVFWLMVMVQKIPALPHQPLFSINRQGKATALSYNQLSARLKNWVITIGENPSDYTLHSLCRGDAYFAHESNMSEQMIRLLGDWTSDAYKRYIDLSMEHRFQSMQAFVQALKNGSI